MKGLNRGADARLLGKIMVARFLEAPLGRVRGLVSEIETSPCFHRVEGLIRAGMVRNAHVADCAEETPGILGEVAKSGNRTGFLYHDAVFAREYVFDDDALARFALARREPALARLASRLRLVNMRNRLTYALVHAVLGWQAEYFESGNPLALRPLSQAQVSAALRRKRSLAATDEGRVSRLVRSLAIRLPGGEDISLQTLFPSRRHGHCQAVAHVIKDERNDMARGALERPLTDGGIAERVERKFGVRLLRRTVAYIRRDLGIPDHRERGRQDDYFVMTSGFSAIFPLSLQALRTWAPKCAGVYEIRADGPAVPGTVYIGSAGDLRKRLTDHLRGNSGNSSLGRIVAEGAGFRYRRVANEWRVVEREVYRAYCKTYGVPPLCNRVSP